MRRHHRHYGFALSSISLSSCLMCLMPLSHKVCVSLRGGSGRWQVVGGPSFWRHLQSPSVCNNSAQETGMQEHGDRQCVWRRGSWHCRDLWASKQGERKHLLSIVTAVGEGDWSQQNNMQSTLRRCNNRATASSRNLSPASQIEVCLPADSAVFSRVL